MVTTVREYRADPADMDEICRKVDEVFADRLAEQGGFVGYELVDGGDGTLMTISVFEDRERAEQSTLLAAEFIRDELPDVALERIGAFTGELRVNRGRARLAELVHA
jgi:quinol monooxygenase YgiN